MGGVPKDEAGIADAIREGVDLLVLQAEYEIDAARSAWTGPKDMLASSSVTTGASGAPGIDWVSVMDY